MLFTTQHRYVWQACTLLSLTERRLTILCWTKSSSKQERGRAIIFSSRKAAKRKKTRRMRPGRTTWGAARIQILWRMVKSGACTTAIPMEGSKWTKWTPRLLAPTSRSSKSLCLTRTLIQIRLTDRPKEGIIQTDPRSRGLRKRKTRRPWATDTIRLSRSTLPSTAKPKSESFKMWRPTITTENILSIHFSISVTNLCALCSKIKIWQLRNSMLIMPWG